MKVAILDLQGKKGNEVKLPSHFSEEFRPDLIKRAVLAKQSHDRQDYGAKPDAGFRQSAKLSRRRRKYRGGYGRGMSRVPRKVMSRRGTQFHYVGATVSGTVGGRRAHPPKAGRDWDQKINIRERRKAIRSAIAATAVSEYVKKRGHKVSDAPYIIDNKIESLNKTKDVLNALEKLGLKAELDRCSEKKVRAGKGKARNRKYRTKTGPLIVVSKKCDIQKSARNILGVDIVTVESLNAELLAPGTQPGRLTLWTQGALERLDKERLFYQRRKVVKEDKK